MLRLLAGRATGFVVAALLLVGITYFYRVILPANQTTVALTFLLVILAVSAVWGMAVSLFMSVTAVLLFNYNFFPPIGTFTVAAPQNWIALFSLLFYSIGGGRHSPCI